MKKGFKKGIGMIVVLAMVMSCIVITPIPASAVTSGYINDINAYNLGDLSGQDGWTIGGTSNANTYAKVATDPKDANNKCIQMYDMDGTTFVNATRNFTSVDGTGGDGIAIAQFRFYAANSQSYESGIQLRSGSNIVVNFKNKYTANKQMLALYNPAIGGEAGDTPIYHQLAEWTSGKGWYALKFVLNFNTQKFDVYFGEGVVPETPTYSNIPFASASGISIDNIHLLTEHYNAQTNNYIDDFSIENEVVNTIGYINNVNSYNLGDLGGQDTWTIGGTSGANTYAKVAADPLNSSNKCIQMYDTDGNTYINATRNFTAVDGTGTNGTATAQFRFYAANSQSYESGIQLRSGSNIVVNFKNKYTANKQMLALYNPAIGGAAGDTPIYHQLAEWTSGKGWYALKFVLNFNTQKFDVYFGEGVVPETPTYSNIPFASASGISIDNVYLLTEHYNRETNNYFDDFSIINEAVAQEEEEDPIWDSVPLGGGGYVTGIVSNSNGSSIYCRSDVGGAFRWLPDADGVNGKWKSISDTMVPYGTSGADGLMSVDGIGTDPNNLNRLYIGAGSSGSGLRGIFSSDDRGATWTQVNTTIRMIGNGGYRANGERLAVDPNNSNIVWYGSCLDGLQKGVKSGDTWTWTQIPTSSVPLGLANAGVTFVVCDKNNGGNTIVYAGVNDSSVGGVYRSTDGGTTWSKVAGDALTAPKRAQISSNGTLYVTGGNAGAAKITRGGSLALMSTLPASTNYHSVAVDPNDASGNTVYVSESKSSACKIWRSTNGGTSWAMQDTIFNEGPVTQFNHARTEPDGTRCLTGYWFGATSSLMINPANSNELWLGDFFGVSRTSNAQNLGTNPGSWWYTLQKGQEETVALDLKNAPSGPRLMMGVADVGGFKYTDITVRPNGAGGNTFGNQYGGNNTSLDFSESNPNIWARTWVQNNVGGSPGSGSISYDGGANWLAFGQITKKNVANSSTAGWETFDVGTYLAKQKAKGVNTVTLVVASTNTAEYSGNTLSFDSKEATDTTKKPKLVINGGTTLNPIADTMVYGGGVTTNYGNSTTMGASYAYGITDRSRWIYLKFDLTSIPTISSASLELSRVSSTNTTIFPVGVYGCNNTTWIEGNGGTDNVPAGEMVWNNKPAALSGTVEPQSSNYYVGGQALTGGRIAVSATDPNLMVWLSINAVPYYSNDRGVSWTASTGAPVSQITGIYTNGNSTSTSGQPLASDRGNSYFYYARFSGATHIVYRSSDGGATWAQVGSVNNGGSYNMRTPQIVAAPVSPTCPTGGDVWMCDDGTYNGYGGGLWRSTNSAANWSGISGVGKVTEVSFGKASSGTGYTVFINGFVNGVKGIYRSDDYGVSWVKLENPTIKEITALAGDRQNYGKVFIGTGGRGTFLGE